MQHEHLETKTNYLFIFMIGFLIGCSILIVVNAQEPNYKGFTKVSTEQSLNGISLGQKELTGETDKLIKPRVTENINPIRREETRGMQVAESKLGELQIKPLLRTGDKKVLVKGFPEDSLAVEYMTYAYQISNGDMDFLMTMKAENGGFDINKQSNVWYIYHYVCKNGLVLSTKDYVHLKYIEYDCKPIHKREDSWGLCQLHRRWHSKIVDDPRFFTDYKWHIEQCWIKYNNGTRFYGYDVRLKYKNDFTILD